MKKKRSHMPFEMLLLLFLGAAGLAAACSPRKVTLTPTIMGLPIAILPTTSTATLHPTAIPSLTETIHPTGTQSHTATVSPTLSLTPTVEPTLTDQASEDYILELLETNGGCKLPCLWGIIPGQTTLGDAKRFSNYLNWQGGDYYNGTVYETAHNYPKHLAISVAWVKNEGMVGTIEIGIAGDDFLNQVKAYSFKQILTDYKVPTQVWINVATALEIETPDVTAFCTLLYYQDSAILVKYCGSAVKTGSTYRLCPTHLNHGNPDELATSGSVTINLGVPGTVDEPRDLTSPFGPFDGMLTVDQALGMNVYEFYRQAMSDTSLICYETKRDVWP